MAALTVPSCSSKPCHQIAIRGLHLLHHIFTPTPHLKSLLSVKKMPITPSDQVSLNMRGSDRSDLGQMTLTSVFSLIKPFNYLAQVPTKSPLQYFQIKPLKARDLDPPERQRANKKAFKRDGQYKEFHLTTDTPAAYLKHVLSKSCEYLLQGSRIQFALHQKSLKAGSSPPIEVALKNCPHLRPDTILRAMPEGTTMLAHPCVAPDARPRMEKRAKADPPLVWAMEHAPSMERAGHRTPKWIRNMAQWNVELEPDPNHVEKISMRLELDPNHVKGPSVKEIYKYSVAKRTEMAREEKAQRRMAHPKEASITPDRKIKQPAWVERSVPLDTT